jgi:hypothetical protein
MVRFPPKRTQLIRSPPPRIFYLNTFLAAHSLYDISVPAYARTTPARYQHNTYDYERETYNLALISYYYFTFTTSLTPYELHVRPS